jgi:hypothetical protein
MVRRMIREKQGSKWENDAILRLENAEFIK